MSEDLEKDTMLVNAKTDDLVVKSRDGEKLAHIDAFMVDKRSGQTTYAILRLGGFLGLGRSYYPLPFNLLSYDLPEDVHIVTIDRRQLEGGPSWANNPPEFNQAYADRVSGYYGSESPKVR